jgi:hypothetical protein
MKFPHLVEGVVHSAWLQDVQIPAETQKLQAVPQNMEQTNLQKYLSAQQQLNEQMRIL